MLATSSITSSRAATPLQRGRCLLTPTLATQAARHARRLHLHQQHAAAAHHQHPQLLHPQQLAPQRRTAGVACAAAASGSARSGPQGLGGGGAAAEDSDDEDEDDSWDAQATCAPAFVSVDQSNPHYSAFSIDVDDYPGLLRVVSWVFNGLGCRVHNAVMRTDEEGRASDVFWVTDLRGRKLSEADAADAAERLEDFLSICAPPDSNDEFKEFTCGDISISNLVHPSLTRVTIQADLFSPGLLLEIASIIHGQGLSVVEGVIRGGIESPITPDMLMTNMKMPNGGGGSAGGVNFTAQEQEQENFIPDPPQGRRIMRFMLKKGRKGQKLDYDDVSALVYTLRAVLGGGNLTTQPPNTELTALDCSSPAGDCRATGSGGSTSGDDDTPCDATAGSGGAGGSGGKGGSRGKGGVTL